MKVIFKYNLIKNIQFKKWYVSEVKTVTEYISYYLKNELRTIYERLHTTKVKLDIITELGVTYEDSHIIGKYYDSKQSKNQSFFTNDLMSLVGTYKEILGRVRKKAYETNVESISEY